MTAAGSQLLANVRCAVYARFSSDRQKDTSIDDQVRRCRDYIVANGGQLDPALVLTDYAVSGASLQRAGMEALRTLVNRREIDVIVVEDQSRITRDFADSGTIFKQIDYNRVRLLCVADGLDTFRKGSKLEYVMKSMINEVYLDDLRDKTRRGMEGRALAGKATGGRCFGYRTTPSPDGAGKQIEIDEAEAEIVRQIFRMYLDGETPRTIAERLDAAGVAPPRSKSPGWRKDTIKAMLKNERYCGVFVFGEREWVKPPSSNRRVPRRNDPTKVLRDERPHLRIIDDATWAAVQSELKRRAPGKVGRPASRKQREYPLSGLLACGVCGGPLTINGSAARKYYACARARQNHNTCTNRRSAPEPELREELVAAIVKQIGTPRAVAFLRERLLESQRERTDNAKSRLKALEREHRNAEAEVRNLVDAFKKVGYSNALATALQSAEAKAKSAERALETARALGASPPTDLPDSNVLLRRVLDLRRMLEDEPDRAHACLRLLLAERPITVEPAEAPHDFVLRGELFPLGLMLQNSNAGSKAEPASSSGGCGDRI